MLAREDNKVFMNFVPPANKWCYTNKIPWVCGMSFGVMTLGKEYDLFFSRRGPGGNWIWVPQIWEADLLTYEIALALFDTIPALS
mgnify:CR=1 FL=1